MSRFSPTVLPTPDQDEFGDFATSVAGALDARRGGAQPRQNGRFVERTLQEAVAVFWERVEKSDGCWLWTGGCYPSGYGQFSCRAVSKRKNGAIEAHRFAWLVTNGPVPEGLEVCHSCDVYGCVRPSHLFLGTHAENMRDSIQKARSPILSPQLACARGHQLVGDNVELNEVRGAVARRCRQCHRETQRARERTPRYREQKAARRLRNIEKVRADDRELKRRTRALRKREVSGVAV